MRLSAIITALLLTITATCGLHAQTSVLDTQIDITTTNKTLKQILSEIEKNYYVRFSYSDNLLPRVHFNHTGQRTSLGQMLNNLLTPNGISYKQIDNQIVLFKSDSKPVYYHLTGYITDSRNSESIINGTLYAQNIGQGAITDGYGYYNMQLPAGHNRLTISNLGYETIDTVITLTGDKLMNIDMKPKSYQMREVVITESIRDEFMESAMKSVRKLNIGRLNELPNVLGEHDALRNLDLMSGLQISEFSTSNISVRGGSGDQTLFLMDDAEIYTAAHIGGFASVYNPDVINHVNIYKDDLPASQSGALSSVIDVRLRDGDMRQWHSSGSIGLLTARAMAEGPIKKDKSSVLIAARRTYVDQVLGPILRSQNFDLKFYFYDINLKFNYKFDNKNRIFLSYYTGTDKINHSMYVKKHNQSAALRFNHIFGEYLVSNLTITDTYDFARLSNFHYSSAYKWYSINWNIKCKLDFTQRIGLNTTLKYGSQTAFYHIGPLHLQTDSTNLRSADSRINAQPIIGQDFYTELTHNIGAKLTILLGARFNIQRSPTDYTNSSDSTITYPDINASVSYRTMPDMLLKLSASLKHQPLHQLQVSSYSISVNRWMPANSRYMPEDSRNISLSAHYMPASNVSTSTSIYYRTQHNLIETLQQMRLIYEIDPEKYARHSSAHIKGFELNASTTIAGLKLDASYDYTDSEWKTLGLNNNKYYPASHIRKHSFNITGIYTINNRIKLSAAWQIASGIPYTSAIGKYMIDNKMVLQFDQNIINSKRLPNYHRLDLSLDIEGQQNSIRRWQSYWNFSIYNAYAHKNPIGVAYFTTNNKNQTVFKPGYYYFYQFVPSISYKFVF